MDQWLISTGDSEVSRRAYHRFDCIIIRVKKPYFVTVICNLYTTLGIADRKLINTLSVQMTGLYEISRGGHTM